MNLRYARHWGVQRLVSVVSLVSGFPDSIKSQQQQQLSRVRVFLNLLKKKKFKKTYARVEDLMESGFSLTTLTTLTNPLLPLLPIFARFCPPAPRTGRPFSPAAAAFSAAPAAPAAPAVASAPRSARCWLPPL